MKRSFVFGLFVIAIGSLALAQTTANVEQEIRQIEEQLRVAAIKSDVAVLERLLADDYTNINPNGLVRTRTEVIADVKSGAAKTTALELSNIKVRVYGDAAVLTCDATVKSQLRGQDTSGQLRRMRIFARRQGRWQAVALQQTRIAK